MELFHAPKLSFEKVAAEVTLPEDPNTWTQEILQELYKLVPYVADFDPKIVLDRVDGEKGYALGHVEVMNRTEIQANTEATLNAAGVKEIRIPIIVKSGKLQPFDTMIQPDSKVVPLTEERLRQSLFRPQTFDTTGKSPGDISMISQLYPPYRQGYGAMGGGVSVGMGKMGSVGLLGTILATVSEEAYLRTTEAIEKYSMAFAANPSCRGALKTLASWTPTKTASVSSLVRPTVASVRRVVDGYEVKFASHHYWAPTTKIVDRGEVFRTFGQKVAEAADTSGEVLMVEGGGTPKKAPAEGGKAISVPGVYRCRTGEGEEVVGAVFPSLMDISGREVPVALFTNGLQSAVQGSMLGTMVAQDLPVFEGGHPKGFGTFIHHHEGKATAMVPVKITGSVNGTLQAETFDGRPAQLAVQPNISCICVADGVTLIPQDASWLPLDISAPLTIATQEEPTKEAAAAALTSVVVRASGHDAFSLSGPPVEKLSYDEKNFLSLPDAAFLLGGLGLTPKAAYEKLAEAGMVNAPLSVPTLRALNHPEDLRKEAHRAATRTVERIHVPGSGTLLAKEAAALPDPTAVDVALSIGFLNPENVAQFIAHLPVIEEAQQKMCELLLASRLGLKEIPTGALERSIRSVEEVLKGLKILAFQSAN